MNYTQYFALWRNIATRHKEILHTPQKAHFASVILSTDPLMGTARQLDEFLNSLRSGLHSPCMVVAAPSADYGDNLSDNYTKQYLGRVVILQDAPLNDWQAQEAAISNTERIGEECLGFAYNHFSENPQEGIMLLDGAANDKLAKLSNRNFFGTGFSFILQQTQTPSLHYNPAKFNLDE